MKFYYANLMGDEGYFEEDCLIKAIYTAWNIEADLWIVEKHNKNEKLLFSPFDTNEFNNELLKQYGYYIKDGKKMGEIREIKTNKEIKYDWLEVKQLV